MKPLDPALVPHLLPARTPLVTVLGTGAAGGLVVVAQAFALGTLVVSLVQDPTGSTWHGPALWTAALLVIRGLLAYVGDAAATRAATVVSTNLRRRLLASTLGRDATSLSHERTGELTLLATRGVAATEPYLTRYVPALVLAAILPVVTLAAIAWLDWLSAVIVLCTLPLVPGFAILIGLVTRDRAERQWRELGALSGHFLDVVRGLPTLVVHRRASAQVRAIRAISERHRRATLDTLRVAFTSSAALELIATISVALVAVAVGLRLAAGGMDFETAMIVLLLAPEAYWPLRRVGAEFHAAAEGTAAFDQITALLEPETPAPVGLAPGHGDLRLDQVSFTYPGRTARALSGVSATIPATGLTAITGPSGCGKSTLLALLMAELTPSQGAVHVSAVDLADVDPASWHDHIAWAPQRPWLAHGTVADNVRTGRPDATDAQVWTALERVDLAATIAALPAGLDTPLGEDGLGLSAGQRARLSLARVLVADRPWVFLDEPSAHLDQATEAILLETLRAESTRRGIVVVAHRAAVVDAADHVIALPAPVVESAEDRPVVVRPSAVVDTTVVPDIPGRWGRRTATTLGSLSVAAGVALTATASWLLARAAEQPPVLVLMVAIVGVRTFGLARPVLRYAERLVSHDLALRLLVDRRVAVYEALIPLTPGRLGARRGDLLTSVVDDVDAVLDRELRVRQPWVTAALVGVGAIGFAAWKSPVAGAITLVAVALGLGAGLIGRWGAAEAEPALVTARAGLSARVTGLLDGARDLVLWGAQGRALAEVDEQAERVARAAQRSSAASSFGRALTFVTTAAAVVATAAWVSGSVSGPMLALLLLLPVALADVNLTLPEAGALSVRTRAAQDRLDALTSREPAVQEPTDPISLPEVRHPGETTTELTATGLAAGWGETPAFTGLDLDLRAGSRIGVVGPSGCGKSTLAASLLAFLTPLDGRIALAGLDLTTLRGDDVRSRISLVDDDPYVFASTVLENVRLARPEADDDEVGQALSRAGLGSWIETLPQGTATMIGEGYDRVSGGERARLGIARALLADPPVLVLDEPTAHLDSDLARRVADRVLAESARSVLWITHGRVGLDRMDEVVVMPAPTQTEWSTPTTASVTGPR